MSSIVPIFFVSCIDYRFDQLAANYLNAIGLGANYFSSTAAGGALPVGFEKYCKKKCCTKGCDPSDSTMELLKNSITTNLDIALTLEPITELYLMNHQDCGAFKEFLACSGYPDTLGENNKKEIKINQDILTYTKEYMKHKYPEKKVKLGLIDINGTVANYDTKTKTWTVVFRGKGNDPNGLWNNVSTTYKQ